MKTDTRNDHFERINKVIIYINQHLNEKLDLDILAEISNFSSFHFHRIMRSYLNESIGAYIIRLRLETAVHLIMYTDLPYNEIAYRVGYDIPSSFNKAFNKRYNATPQQFRERKYESVSDFNWIAKPQPQLNYLLKPEIKLLGDKRLVYIQIRGKYGNEDYDIAWKKIFEFATKLHLFRWNTETIGISFDNPTITEEEYCQYNACLSIQKEIKPDGEFGVMVLPAGYYAIFKYKGAYSNLDYVYNAIMRDWLPQSGYNLRDTYIFDKYVNNTNHTKPEKLITEIYLPVEK